MPIAFLNPSLILSRFLAPRFCPEYVENVAACVEKVIDFTQESLKNIRTSTKVVVAPEENPEEYSFD